MAKRETSMFAGRPAFVRLKQMLNDNNSVRDVLWEHEVGMLVDKLCPRESRTYGQGKILRLAKELGQGTSLANKLWNARKLAVALSRNQLTGLARLARKSEFNLTASHVLSLVTFKQEEKLVSLAKECIQQSWTVKRLRREIQRIQGKQSKGGAPIVELASVEEALDDLTERTRSWLARYDNAWFGSSETKLSPPLDLNLADAAAVERVREAEELLLELQKAAAEGRRQLRQQRRRASSVASSVKSQKSTAKRKTGGKIRKGRKP